MASQQQASNTPINERDLWRTPDYVFAWAHRRFAFDIDLAADDENTLCSEYFTQGNSALDYAWQDHGEFGWLNPPYSDPSVWMEKAYESAREGFTTVMLVPTPNGESQYRDYVYGNAQKIIMINGRLSFIAGGDYTIKGKSGKPDRHIKKGDEVNGNGRGSCFIIYAPKKGFTTKLEWIDRDVMRNDYEAARLQRAAGQ